MKVTDVQLVDLAVGPNWEVRYNALHNLAPADVPLVEGISSEDVWMLFSQDLVQIYHRGTRELIDVGWYPDHNPDGLFRLIALDPTTGENNYDWQNPRLEFETRDLSHLLYQISTLTR